MTPAQRTTLSFLDLALIMTGVMAMIASVGDRHPAVADALVDSFGKPGAALAQRTSLPIARLFEPQEARLTGEGAAQIAAVARKAQAARIDIRVPVVAEKAHRGSTGGNSPLRALPRSCGCSPIRGSPTAR